MKIKIMKEEKDLISSKWMINLDKLNISINSEIKKFECSVKDCFFYGSYTCKSIFITLKELKECEKNYQKKIFLKKT